MHRNMVTIDIYSYNESIGYKQQSLAPSARENLKSCPDGHNPPSSRSTTVLLPIHIVVHVPVLSTRSTRFFSVAPTTPEMKRDEREDISTTMTTIALDLLN